MEPSLHSLLQRLAPEPAVHRFRREVDRAFNSFDMNGHAVWHEHDLRRCLGWFEFHLANSKDGAWRPFPAGEERQWQERAEIRARRVLEVPSLARLMDIATHGVGGGIYGVLRQLADDTAVERSRRYIEQEVAIFIGRLSDREQEIVLAQYYEHFHSTLIMDQSLSLYQGRRLDLKKLLESHSDRVQHAQMRSAWQRSQ